MKSDFVRCSPVGTRILLAFAATRRWPLIKADVESAFLRAVKAERRVYVRLCRESRDKCHHWLPLSAAYDLFHSNAKFQCRLTRRLQILANRTRRLSWAVWQDCKMANCVLWLTRFSMIYWYQNWANKLRNSWIGSTIVSCLVLLSSDLTFLRSLAYLLSGPKIFLSQLTLMINSTQLSGTRFFELVDAESCPG